jgi:hypothetical protein
MDRCRSRGNRNVMEEEKDRRLAGSGAGAQAKSSPPDCGSISKKNALLISADLLPTEMQNWTSLRQSNNEITTARYALAW